MKTFNRLGSRDRSDLVKTSRTAGSRSERSSLPEWAAVTTKGRSRSATAGEARELLARVALPQQCPLHRSPKLFLTTTRKMGRSSLAAFSFAALRVGTQSSW